MNIFRTRGFSTVSLGGNVNQCNDLFAILYLNQGEMMNITVETVQRIIDLAAILYSEENLRQQDSLSAEEFLMAPTQPDYQNLLRTIESLPQQEFAELTALMWIGRGEGDFSDWETLIELAKQNSVPGYVFEKIYLAQALRTALEKLPEDF